MEAAVEGRAKGLKLLAVTVLTSFDESDVENDGHTLRLAELVEKRVGNAIAAGVDGIVCSGLEVAKVRKMTGPKMTLVIGCAMWKIRKRSARNQRLRHKRLRTAQVIWCMVSEEVTRAADPRAEMLKILYEVYTPQ